MKARLKRILNLQTTVAFVLGAWANTLFGRTLWTPPKIFDIALYAVLGICVLILLLSMIRMYRVVQVIRRENGRKL